MFEVFFSEKADNQYNKLQKTDKLKIDKILQRLRLDPYKFSKKLKGEFEGLYAIRAWPYRITYIIELKKIYIISIKHRQSIYK